MNMHLKLKAANRVSLITVYDNYLHNSDLETGWGFACVVKVDDNTILFDTGGDGRILLKNMEKSGIGPSEVDTVVLSHIHGDHTGGIVEFLQRNSDVTVWIPLSFPDSFQKVVMQMGAQKVNVYAPVPICQSVSTTGELGSWLREQAMVVNTSRGLVVVTGCAHPGIVDVVRSAKVKTGEDVYLVIGGFHLGGAIDSEIISIIDSFKRLKVKKAAPCHCSGNLTRKLYAQYYGGDYIENGVGKEIIIE
jgi:7,8-dihydropterin-6-yl-methyl-4-(beta-D-ribofuranosyl)aminobenzene 5'-phosphate synthase